MEYSSQLGCSNKYLMGYLQTFKNVNSNGQTQKTLNVVILWCCLSDLTSSNKLMRLNNTLNNALYNALYILSLGSSYSPADQRHPTLSVPAWWSHPLFP